MNRAPVFTAVRTIVLSIAKRGLTQEEVDALDDAFDLGEGRAPDPPSAPEADFTPQHIGAAGVALLKRCEGCAKARPDGRFEAYPDPGSGGDPWTIGWGATGQGIAPGVIWTQAECDARLVNDMVRYSDAVKRALGPALERTSQNQFDALVSFHYNTGAIARATLTAKHIAGDFAGAAAEFARWNKAAGQVMRGLVRRREAEAELYRTGS